MLALRRAQHEQMPSSSTYRALRAAAEALDAWPLEQDAARATLQRTDARGFVDALLSDDELELAWKTALVAPRDALGSDLWLRLAERRERDRPPTRSRSTSGSPTRCSSTPTGARTDRPHGSFSAPAAAQAAGELDAFAEYLAGLRERYRRRPTLIAILDKAGLR